MAGRTIAHRLQDMIEACERVRGTLSGVSLDDFELDWEKRWLVERGVEILSEASRHLTEEIKVQRPEIAWSKVAGIGNVLRHDYDRIAPDVLWKLAQDDLPLLESVCREELAATLTREADPDQ